VNGLYRANGKSQDKGIKPENFLMYFPVFVIKWQLHSKRLERTMESIIEKNRQAIAELCRKYHVARLDVFGSIVTGDFNESSDVDFLVEFDTNVDKYRFDVFFELLRAMERLFHRRVDLVEAGGLRNPYFIKRVNETRRPVYVAA